MEVRVTRTTTKTIAAYVIAIEGSFSSNNKYKNTNSCDKRAIVVMEEWLQQQQQQKCYLR
jgi:hypothetical protein